MKTLRSTALMVIVGLFATGCTITKVKLTGTEGAAYKGHYRVSSGGRQVHSGALPGGWLVYALGVGSWMRLEECEYHKADTNASLVLNYRTHGSKGVVTAPPGTEGVRVVREAKTYQTETF